MKRIFLAKRNALLTSTNAIRVAVGFLVFCIVIVVRLFAPNFFWRVTAPVFDAAARTAAGARSGIASFGSAAALSNANDTLRAQNLALADENRTLVNKIQSLTSLLGTSPAEKSSIVAGVVARPPESPYDTLLVAAGAKDGVALGMEAFGAGGVPIGIVSETFADFSRVTLFTAPGVITNGWVGHANTALVLTGTGGGTWQALVAKAAHIAIDDAVFLPGPGAHMAGNVVRIDSDPLSPADTLRVEPAVNLFSLDWVLLRAAGPAPFTLATSTHS